MPKGEKRVKGVGALHNEPKKRYSITLTPTCVANLDAIAKKRGISRSELVEQIGRGLIPLADQTTSQNERDTEQHISTNETSSKESSPEVITEAQALHLSQWEQLPESQGDYIIYVREGTHRTYRPDSSNISSMKKQFMADLQSQPELQELMAPNKDAYLLWSGCNKKKLLPEIRSHLSEYYQKLKDESRFRDTQLRKPPIEDPFEDDEDELPLRWRMIDI